MVNLGNPRVFLGNLNIFEQVILRVCLFKDAYSFGSQFNLAYTLRSWVLFLIKHIKGGELDALFVFFTRLLFNPGGLFDGFVFLINKGIRLN